MTTWQYMWRLFTYRPAEFAVNLILWGLFHLIPLAYAVLTKGVFDALSGAAPVGWNVWTLLALLGAATLTRSGVFWIAFRLFSAYYMMIQALLRYNLLDYLMRAAGSREMVESSSEAVTRFRDDVEDVSEYLEQWIDLLGFVLYGASGLFVLYTIDPVITVVACAPTFLMAVIMRRLGGLIRSYRRAFREATAYVTGFIGESFAAIGAIKVAGKEAPMADRFEALGHARKRAALRDTLLKELVDSVNTNLVNVGAGAVLILAAEQMRTGSFTVGDFALYINILPRLTRVLSFVGRVMAQHKRSGVAFERMNYLLQDAPPQQVVAHTPLYLGGDAPDGTQNGTQAETQAETHAETHVSSMAEKRAEYRPLDLLEVRGLSYTYPGSEAGIQDVSFSVGRGDFVVITGRIGAGKTTLLRVLQGLLPMSAGEIYWNGERVEDPASFFGPPHSAYTSQVPRLFSESLRANILLGEAREERLKRALGLAVLNPDVAALEHGLETLVGTRGVKLSGGQVQRSAAARMFTREADLLIFDDLSSALDVQTEQTLWRSLFREQDATCLVVSHRMAALQRATRVIVLDGGRVVAAGSPAAVLAEAGDFLGSLRPLNDGGRALDRHQ